MASVSIVRMARATLVQTSREFILLPFWWYSAGFLKMTRWYLESIKNVSVLFGIKVWVKNLFVPMYGDTSFVGRMISFGIRFFVILVRGVGVMIWAFMLSILFLVYLFSLPFFVILFLIHFFGVIFG